MSGNRLGFNDNANCFTCVNLLKLCICVYTHAHMGQSQPQWFFLFICVNLLKLYVCVCTHGAKSTSVVLSQVSPCPRDPWKSYTARKAGQWAPGIYMPGLLFSSMVITSAATYMTFMWTLGSNFGLHTPYTLVLCVKTWTPIIHL